MILVPIRPWVGLLSPGPMRMDLSGWLPGTNLDVINTDDRDQVRFRFAISSIEESTLDTDGYFGFLLDDF